MINVFGGTYPPSINDIDDFVAEGMGYFTAEHLMSTSSTPARRRSAFEEVAIGKGDVCTGSSSR